MVHVKNIITKRNTVPIPTSSRAKVRAKAKVIQSIKQFQHVHLLVQALLPPVLVPAPAQVPLHVVVLVLPVHVVVLVAVVIKSNKEKEIRKKGNKKERKGNEFLKKKSSL